MALVVNHNMMAVNTARMLNTNYNKLNTSVQRLSSGLRINSAADDAAGLAIRELMRSDITTLNQGIRNANDAISLIQTADGALSVIDEKLIRMKELAEQAATGTYNSTQRLIIDSEFQQMASEIDRIANATDFNGIHLLNGTLAGEHDGSNLVSTGAMKIHFGTGNDSAEDYYYIDIADCTVAGLGLYTNEDENNPWRNVPPASRQPGPLKTWKELGLPQGEWRFVEKLADDTIDDNFMFIIPKGSKNVLVSMLGAATVGNTVIGDNDIELFTKNGVHLAGTRPSDDFVFTGLGGGDIDANSNELGFNKAKYNGTNLNTGSNPYNVNTLNYTTYNGMKIGYTGDSVGMNDPTNGAPENGPDYEFLTIDEATEDLIVWTPGTGGVYVKYEEFPDQGMSAQARQANALAPVKKYTQTQNGIQQVDDLQAKQVLSIETQEKAQKALPKLDEAIVQKDNVRAHLGALQNRFENTITNLEVQAENLQASESRISDVDVATEMTEFIRNQILTQTAVAMLAQANNLPQMALQLLQ